MLFLLPIAIFPTPERGLVLILIPAFWIWRKWSAGYFTQPTPFDWPVRLLSFMVVMSGIVSFNQDWSLSRVVAVLYGLALLYTIAATSNRSRWYLQVSVIVFLLMGVGIATLSLFGTRWVAKFPLLRPIINRLPQLITLPGASEGFQANQVAGTLLWIIPVAIALTFSLIFLRGMVHGDFLHRHMIRFLFLGITGLLGFVMLLTQSRSALLGLGIAVVLLGMLAWHRYRWVAWSLPFLVIIFLVGMVQLIGVERVQAQLIADRDLGEDGSIESFGLREEIWVRAVYAIADFPLTGMGMNTFRFVAPPLYPLLLFPSGGDISHAHNQFLQAALDVGIPGLIGYVGMWLVAAAMLWQVWRHTIDPWYRTYAAGFAASLVASFIYGLTDAVAFGAKPGFLFWMLLGLIAGLHELVINRQTA